MNEQLFWFCLLLLILATYVGVNTIIYFAEVASDTDIRVNIENAYKTRWVWYHTILCLNLFLTNILLICLLTLISLNVVGGA